MEYYSRALAIEPNSPELITNIGWLLELQGHLIEARAHYLKALELMKPHSHPQIVNNLKNIDVRIEQQMGIKDEVLHARSQRSSTRRSGAERRGGGIGGSNMRNKDEL